MFFFLQKFLLHGSLTSFFTIFLTQAFIETKRFFCKKKDKNLSDAIKSIEEIIQKNFMYIVIFIFISLIINWDGVCNFVKISSIR